MKRPPRRGPLSEYLDQRPLPLEAPALTVRQKRSQREVRVTAASIGMSGKRFREALAGCAKLPRRVRS